ncbi:MAG: M50 family metallopeptidase [Verrucomicrobiota bacterium]
MIRLASGGRILNAGAVPKWIKLLVAVCLLPVCAGAARTLWAVLRLDFGADTVWVALLAGAACWLLIFSLLPKPMWLYVFGHELTHALWTWLFGGRVKKMKVSAKGGHVVVTKTNFLISLAPYFFPLYTVLVIAGFVLGNWLWDWHQERVWFHLLLGAAYAFHVTLTLHVLQTRQSDVTDQGYLFSAVVIFLGNISVLLLGISLLGRRLGILKILALAGAETGQVFRWLSHGW